MKLPKPSHILPASALILTFAVGCGGEKTDVSGGVDQLNKQFSAQGITIDCPKEVDGGEGAEFECTMKGTESGKESKVKLKVVKEEGELAVDIADQEQFQSAIQSVSG